MRYSITGLMPLDFKSSDGKQITGTSIYVTYADNNKTLVGIKTDKLFINSATEIPSGLKPGDAIEVNFTKNGKVEKITITK